MTTPDKFPPADQLPAPLAKLWKEWAKLETERRAVVTELQTAERSDLAAARQLDVARSADQVRAGKPDPGPVEEEKVKARIVALRRQGEVLARACADVAGELDAALEEAAPTWLAGLDAKIDKARDEHVAAIEVLDASRQTWAELVGTRTWAARPTVPYRSSPGGHVGDLLRPSGEPLSWLAVVAALRSSAQPPVVADQPLEGAVREA